MKNNSGKKLILASIFILFSLGLVSLADSSQAGQTAANLKQEVVKLKYVKADAVKQLLIPYFEQYTLISADAPNNILTIRDTPENLEKILAAIRKIDAKPKDMLFTVQLIIGSEADGQTDPELKGDPLIKELQKLLRYKSYQPLDSTLIRAVDRESSMISFGPKNDFQIEIKPKVSEESPQPNIDLEITLQRGRRGPNIIEKSGPVIELGPVLLIKSHLNLRSGDRAVVGVSKLDGKLTPQPENKGLILIITGKVLD